MSDPVRRVRVGLPGGRGYTVEVCTDGARALGAWLARQPRPVIVVTDRRVERAVWRRWAGRVRATAGRELVVARVDAGEASKSLRQVERLERQFLSAGLGRDGLVVAVGGGVVTDLAGFAAATYMRGIDWVAVPTTLLGMVDAAVGGKVGVNLARKKNLVGAFHQPQRVIAGADALQTLPRRQRANGMAEVVKYAMIADRRLFAALERRGADLLVGEPRADARLVARCCRIKARFVAADEREAGVRAALNFGHTVGHALEGDGRRWLHGEAVGLGMRVACEAAVRLGRAHPEVGKRLRGVLAALRLPVTTGNAWAPQRWQQAWRADKKARGGSPRLVLVPKIGQVETGVAIDEALLRESLNAIRERPGRPRRHEP